MARERIPDLFEIDDRMGFELWLGTMASRVSWQGRGISLRTPEGNQIGMPGDFVVIEGNKIWIEPATPHTQEAGE